MKILLAIPMSLALSGCVDFNPPPPRVSVPPADSRSGQVTRHSDVMLPIRQQDPQQYAQSGGRPFDDEPLVTQQMPEQPQFVDAYRKVGSPKIALFVNRTLEGKIMTSDDAGPNRGQPSGYERPQDGYLHSGQYDETDAKRIDYEAIENIMTDWLSCDGQVSVVSPTMARQRLSDQTVREMQQGRPQVLSEVAQQLGCDILIQVQAHPTLQTQQGLRVRLVAEALNIRDGLSVSRAVVDMEPPLEKTTINRYTRFMTRKLVDGMLGTWSSPPPAEPRSGIGSTMGPDGSSASAPPVAGGVRPGSAPVANPSSVEPPTDGTRPNPTTIQPPRIDPSLAAPPTTEPQRP